MCFVFLQKHRSRFRKRCMVATPSPTLGLSLAGLHTADTRRAPPHPVVTRITPRATPPPRDESPIHPQRCHVASHRRKRKHHHHCLLGDASLDDTHGLLHRRQLGERGNREVPAGRRGERGDLLGLLLEDALDGRGHAAHGDRHGGGVLVARHRLDAHGHVAHEAGELEAVLGVQVVLLGGKELGRVVLLARGVAAAADQRVLLGVDQRPHQVGRARHHGLHHLV
mmetsp:Transcript_15642/g.37962  ORF Transcript_15642/g.37962 Transcript_15642/m.37962 type:complete len:225 (+) Transcript_15642:18-692(+)